MDVISQLKQLNPDAASLDQMIILSAFAKILEAEYGAKQISRPEWLDDSQRTLAREIQARTRDAKELRLRELEQAEKSLESATEKRERIRKEREALQAELATTR